MLSPSMWPGALTVCGTTWQLVHTTAWYEVDTARWAWCAPTVGVVVAVFPARSFGGAALFVEPWHEVHPPVAPGMTTSTTPLIWLSGSRKLSEFSSMVGWQDAQLLPVGCGGGGGAPWQLPHADCEPSTRVHVGVGLVPPHAAWPWQPAVHVVPFHFDAVPPARVLKITSALPSPSMWPGASTVCGTTWQSAHSTLWCHDGEARRCAWCAPTAVAVVSITPETLFGGALLVSVP